MVFYYEVYHPANPKGAVVVAFKHKPSPMRIRDKACSEGHFSWKFYTELRYRATTKPIPLDLFGD